MLGNRRSGVCVYGLAEAIFSHKDHKITKLRQSLDD